jgi:hypothetical protein
MSERKETMRKRKERRDSERMGERFERKKESTRGLERYREEGEETWEVG